jgi:hypothetical protein
MSATSSTNNAHESKGTDKKFTFFVELNYLSEIESKDGIKDNKFQSTYVPYIRIPLFLQAYADYNNLSYSQVASSNSTEMFDVLDQVTPIFIDPKERDTLISNTVKIIEFSKVKSTSEMNRYLSENIKSASFGEKTVFLANVLSLLSDNYDSEMTEEGYKEVRVNDMDMLSAMNESILTGNPTPSGVCRHIHQFAIRIAKSIGMDNAFGVDFNSPRGGHKTLVLGVPGSPSQVVQLNYGQKVELGTVTGTEALTQNHSIPSTGIRFRIYNGKDESSIILPSEQGGILNLLSGGTDSDLAHGYETESIIQQFGVKTPYGTFRAFKANSTERGYTKFEGIGYDIDFSFFKYFSNELGFAGFQNQRTVLNKETLKTEGLYIRDKLSFQWEFYEGDRLNISTFTDLHLRASLYCTTYKGIDCKTNQDFSADIHSGIKAQYKFTRGKFNTEIKAHTQMANEHGSYTTKQTLIIPAVTILNTLQLQLTDDFFSEHEVSVTHYDLGTNVYNVFKSTNSLNSNTYDLELYHSYGAPITEDTPVWLPGASKVNRYGVKKFFLSKKIEINANYESRAYEAEKFFGVNIKVVY